MIGRSPLGAAWPFLGAAALLFVLSAYSEAEDAPGQARRTEDRAGSGMTAAARTARSRPR